MWHRRVVTQSDPLISSAQRSEVDHPDWIVAFCRLSDIESRPASPRRFPGDMSAAIPPTAETCTAVRCTANRLRRT